MKRFHMLFSILILMSLLASPAMAGLPDDEVFSERPDRENLVENLTIPVEVLPVEPVVLDQVQRRGQQPQVETARITKIVREHVLQPTQVAYKKALIEVLFDGFPTPEWLLVYLPHRDSYRFDIVTLKLGAEYTVLAVEHELVPEAKKRKQEVSRLKAEVMAITACPDPSVEMVFAVPASELEDPTAYDAVNKAVADATAAGYTAITLLDQEATISAYQNWLTCPLEAFANIGHGAPDGILVADGVLWADWFESLAPTALNDTVLYFDACEVHNAPLEPAIMNAGARTFIGGDTNLRIGPAEEVFKHFWESMLLHTEEMADRLDYWEDWIRETIDEPGTYGLSGDYGIFAGTAIPAPTGMSASDGTEPYSVNITWDAVPEATHYKVYRNTTETLYDAVAVSDWQTELSFEDKSVKLGRTYTYWAKAATSATSANASRGSDPDTGHTGVTLSCDLAIGIPESECDALVALYDETDGENWLQDRGWLDTFFPCTWYGVTCEEGHVRELQLRKNHLSGALPPELGNLQNLKVLNLYHNQLSGALPPELGNLQNLEMLILNSNLLSGALPPELGNLQNLKVLNLRYNLVNDLLPPEIGNLQKLKTLSLDGNQLSGSIPSELGNLTDLEWMSIWYNQLSGSLPPELGNLINLKELNLAHNQLSGSLPPEIGNLINLEMLNLAANQLSGLLPPELGNLSNLETLALAFNQLSGPLPLELGNLINLEDLLLYSNQLSGLLPPELGRLNSLIFLVLSGNRLSGQIPPEFGNLSKLEVLNLSANQLSGMIPTELDNLHNLGTLSLEENQLSGPIPPELGDLHNLESLSLEENQLSGSIPPELGNLSNLVRLRLEKNQLSGPIPPELGNLSLLSVLNLQHNQLRGPLPPQFGRLTNLGELDISYNSLNGPLPMTLGQLTNMNSFSFNDTGLCVPDDYALQAWLDRVTPSGHGTGIPCSFGCEQVTEIPPKECNALVQLYTSTGGDQWTNDTDWLYDLNPCHWAGVTCDEEGHVIRVRLSANNLTGVLPSELGDLVALQQLDLSDNSLRGFLPTTLTGLGFLQLLWFDQTFLCETQDPAFQDWITAVPSVQSTGTACATFHTIAGHVRTKAGDGLEGVVLAGLPGTPVTDAAGAYQAMVEPGWTGEAEEPQKSGYYFFPEGRWYSNLTLSLEHEDYTAFCFPSEPVVPTAPLGTITTSTPTFTWDKDRGAIQYFLEFVDLDNTLVFSQIYTPEEANCQKSGPCTVTLPFSLTDGLYTWKVSQNACDGGWMEGTENTFRVCTGGDCPFDCTLATQIATGECEALVSLYTSTGGEQWTHQDGWLDTFTPCNWSGVACESGHVAGLDLSSNELLGTLPSEIGTLSQLHTLNLNDNSLSGSIPPELGDLNQLQLLSMNTNALTGTLPESLGNLSNLRVFWLKDNPDLSGPLPASLTALTLTSFVFEDTALCEPQDPAFQAWLASIPNVFGTGVPCQFSCEQVTQIPTGECEALVSLYTSTNGDQWTRRDGWLDTPTPCNWSGVGCQSGQVVSLSLQWNRLSGNLPPQFGNLSGLQYLILSQNQLSGSLPPELGDLHNLRYLHLNDNQFSGNLPPELGNLSSLQYLIAGRNPISGNLPPELGNLGSLRYLYLAESDLSGSLPLSLSQLDRVSRLNFHATDLCEPDDPALQAWLDRVSPPGYRSDIVCPSELTITAKAGKGGDIEPRGEVAVPYDHDQIFFITSEDGYTLDQLLVDGIDRLDDSYQTASGTFYTFEHAISDYTIEAAFQAASAPVITPIDEEEIDPVLTVVTIRKRGTGQGTIMAEGQACGPDCPKLVVPYVKGKQFSVTVEPAAGSSFVGWETAEGMPLKDIYYVSPDETVYTVFEQQYEIRQ